MQFPLTFPRTPRVRRPLKSLLLVPLLAGGAGCYMFEKPATGDRTVATEYRRAKAASPAPIRFPDELLGAPAAAARELSGESADSRPARFLAACARFRSVHCENRPYGDRLLQVAVFDTPPAALGVMGELAFGAERYSRRRKKDGQEWSFGDGWLMSRQGHRVAQLVGPGVGGDEKSARRQAARLDRLVRPGGADAGLEFLVIWRRLGVDRSKVRFQNDFWGNAGTGGFSTPIDAGELFFFEGSETSKLIAAEMATEEFSVVSGKRLIFNSPTHGETQMILGVGWAMGIEQVADPARAGAFLDGALYAPKAQTSQGLGPTPAETGWDQPTQRH